MQIEIDERHSRTRFATAYVERDRAHVIIMITELLVEEAEQRFQSCTGKLILLPRNVDGREQALVEPWYGEIHYRQARFAGLITQIDPILQTMLA